MYIFETKNNIQFCVQTLYAAGERARGARTSLQKQRFSFKCAEHKLYTYIYCF